MALLHRNGKWAWISTLDSEGVGAVWYDTPEEAEASVVRAGTTLDSAGLETVTVITEYAGVLNES